MAVSCCSSNHLVASHNQCSHSPIPPPKRPHSRHSPEASRRAFANRHEFLFARESRPRFVQGEIASDRFCGRPPVPAQDYDAKRRRVDRATSYPPFNGTAIDRILGDLKARV